MQTLPLIFNFVIIRLKVSKVKLAEWLVRAHGGGLTAHWMCQN
jgi:hypothetical protein